MKAILILFDSLQRKMLPQYGCEDIHAPNFKRLEEKTVTFDNCYTGSLPCMPARRELHTGRYNFLHRSWGPIEPFDDSMPEILKNRGTHTHLVSDHIHYWEDGGSTYHTRYSTWEVSRGQEGDVWKGQIKDPEIPPCVGDDRERVGFQKTLIRQDWVNRQWMQNEGDFPQTKTFAKGLEFLRTNHQDDNWFLQIETFDPHEPFYVPEDYKDLYPSDYTGPHFDWPSYGKVRERIEEVEKCRRNYAALVSMCDKNLGKILDFMDQHNMWEDTMLVVGTDHGFMLAEHDWWGKLVMPFFNEVSHIPLNIWDPRSGRKGERNKEIVQMIDFAPTLLRFFDAELPQDMQGIDLKDTLEMSTPVRPAALFGAHGGHVNCTDGRFVYMRAPESRNNAPLYNYTLLPLHMRKRFDVDELKDAELVGPFEFTKECPVLKVKARGMASIDTNPYDFGTLLFDLDNDPEQVTPIDDEVTENRMKKLMIGLMKENNAPSEQFQRLGLI